MNWFQIALMIFQIAPKILELIGQVEATIGAGHGGIKKAIVMAPLAGAPPEVAAAVSSLIDTVVAAKNTLPATVVAAVPPTA